MEAHRRETGRSVITTGRCAATVGSIARNAIVPRATPGPKGSPSGKPQTHEEQSVQGEHGDPRALLHGVRVVVEVDVFFGEGALVLLVGKGPQGAGSKTGRSDEAPNPELDQRRVFRIDAKIAKSYVGDAGSNVIGLVDCESVETCRNGGANDGCRDEKNQQTTEEKYVNARCVPTTCAGRRGVWRH